MAEKTAKTAASETPFSADALGDVTERVQQQCLSMLEQSQSAVIAALGKASETVGKAGLPSIPGVKGFYSVPTDAIDGLFDFGATLLENQKRFAHDLLSATDATS